MINPIELHARAAVSAPCVSSNGKASGTAFADVFAAQLRNADGVKFSAHATQRLADRRIALSQHDKASISRAVDKAAAKGARETLLLMDKLAFVVSVPNRTVITAMPQHELGDTVFTNIDSAVVVAPEAKDIGA
jgi:flagellar operon protein